MHCASCQTVNPAGNRFCGQCGTALLRADALPQWGELKQATVLFADIVGSTEQIAGLDPEQAMSRLRPAILRMCESVERFGGTVVRTLGDGVMALFGVPKALEGHALLACEAALHMQGVFQTDPHGLAIRIGLHSGAVASDPNEADSGRGGGAHGLTIHLASRVVGLAQQGGICLTEACRTLAGPRVVVRPQGVHALRGIGEEVELHTLTGLLEAAAMLLQGGVAVTPFRGRQTELARLVALLDGVATTGGRAVGICGEPGAGKSRLCHEFARTCEGRGLRVVAVRAQLYGHAMPLQPVLELLRLYFLGIRPGDSAAVARERVAMHLASLSLPEADLTLLHEFLGVIAPGASPTAMGPKARQARLLALVTQIFRMEASQPRLILIEDLHWLDDASEAFVIALVDAVAGTQTVLALNYRTTYQPPWARIAHFEQLDLRELHAQDMRQLVAELLAPLGSRADVCQLVVDRSGGNPFFAEELVRMLIDRKLLGPDNQLPEGGLDAIAKALPATVQAVIGARLDRLGEPEKTLLQMCAIIGKEIPLAVLEHVASPLAGQIERGLDGLCAAQLILPQPAEGGRRFAFRHPLIQEVAYGTQLKVRRGHVHSSVAAAMEIYYQAQLDEYASLIGYHFEQAGLALPAAQYTARAATWVGSANAAQAIKHWRKARALLNDLPRTPEVDELRVTAGGKVALLGWREGLTLSEVKPLIDEAVSLAVQSDDRIIPWLLTIEGRMLVASGGPADGYVDSAKKALMYIDVDRDTGRMATASAFLSQAYSWAGMVREALQANDVALRYAAQVDAFDREFIGFSVEQWAMGMRGRLLARAGQLDEARLCLQKMQTMEASSAEPPVHGMSHFGWVELAWCLGDRALADENAAALARLADKHGSPYLQAFALGSLGCAASLAERHPQALTHFTGALELIRSTGAAKEYETEVLAGLAECHLLKGDAEEAYAVATEAIKLSRLRSTRLPECRALVVRATAARHIPAHADSSAADFVMANHLIELTGAAVYGPWMNRFKALASLQRAK